MIKKHCTSRSPGLKEHRGIPKCPQEGLSVLKEPSVQLTEDKAASPFKRSMVKWGDVPVTIAVPSGTPKLSGIKQPFTGLTGSVGWEFRTQWGWLCLCSMVSRLEGSK